MARRPPRTLRQRLRIKWRWGWRRIERRLPAWTRRSLPWGTSLLAHAALLLLLAVVIRFAQSEPARAIEAFSPATEDVTSTVAAERSGDPFTHLDSEDPPSLPPDLTKTDTTTIAVAELPPDVRLGPELDLTPDTILETARDEAGPVGFAGGGPGMSSPFRGRSKVERARLVRREGGTVESEAAVERGLDWLARHQRPDGSWSLKANEVCVDPPCPERGIVRSDVAATGLALLPMLGAGHTHVEKGRYQQNIRAGLAWLVKQQQPDGLIYTGGALNAMVYSHSIATMVLCEAYGLTKDPELFQAAKRAVGYLARSQHVYGGWRYAPMNEGDTSVHGWVIFALRSAELSGIPVPKRTVKQAKRFLDGVASKSKALYSYMPGRRVTPTMTAEALVCRQILGWPRDLPPLREGVSYIVADLAASKERNIYYWYYATQLLHNMRGKDWPEWNRTVRDNLVAMQVRSKGCDHGSWDPLDPTEDAWGESAGRLFTTSLSLLTLEVYYRYLPLYRDQGGEMTGSDAELADAEAAPVRDKPDPDDPEGEMNDDDPDGQGEAGPEVGSGDEGEEGEVIDASFGAAAGSDHSTWGASPQISSSA